ncbi:MAG TPA: hypothetical protein VGB85_16540 [Nannocystis sp.]
MRVMIVLLLSALTLAEARADVTPEPGRPRWDEYPPPPPPPPPEPALPVLVTAALALAVCGGLALRRPGLARGTA